MEVLLRKTGISIMERCDFIGKMSKKTNSFLEFLESSCPFNVTLEL